MLNFCVFGDVYTARCSANKNCFSAGLILRTKQSTVNASPAFEWFVFTVFTVCQFRNDHSTRLDIEAERGSVLKANVDYAFIRRNNEFYCLNYLALRLREFDLFHDGYFDNLSEVTDRSEESYKRKSKGVKGKH